MTLNAGSQCRMQAGSSSGMASCLFQCANSLHREVWTMFSKVTERLCIQMYKEDSSGNMTLNITLYLMITLNGDYNVCTLPNLTLPVFALQTQIVGNRSISQCLQRQTQLALWAISLWRCCYYDGG